MSDDKLKKPGQLGMIAIVGGDMKIGKTAKILTDSFGAQVAGNVEIDGIIGREILPSPLEKNWTRWIGIVFGALVGIVSIVGVAYQIWG